ncbi:MAG: AraC family transcriptional regulator [Flavobacteriaceae bacterium]|nr:AraC family transcriptional regulator [Flavobacteriaceae bacterium]|tara:strand:+ start:93 stop:962 length:870 start_codon:yes stop_codon:yes gene_type:complete
MKIELEPISFENKSFSYNIYDEKNHNPKEKHQKWHYHPEIELVYVNNGSGKRQVGLNLSNYNDGLLILVGSNLPHTGFTDYFDKSRKEVVIQFKEDFIGDSIKKVFEFKNILSLIKTSEKGIVFNGEIKKKIGLAMLGLQYETNFQKIITLITILNDLSMSNDYEILNISNYNIDGINENDRIKKAFNFIKENYKNDVLLKEIANEVHMTVPSFCRYFKSQTNKTFIEFLIEYRINNALKLLTHTEKDIKNISFECGFNNYSHFNRSFKKINSISPSDYRKKINKSQLI